MIDRRQVLSASVAAATAGFVPALHADEGSAADLRRLVDRLAGRSRTARPGALRRFNADRLSPRERVLYETLIPGAEADAALARRAWGKSGAPYSVTHRNGAWRAAAELREGADIRSSLRAVNQDTSTIRSEAARGMTPPDFVIDATLPALRAAAQRLRAANTADRETLAAALSRQADTLEAQRPTASSEPGVWRLPDGEAFYTQALQFQLGAPVDPREAHERALHVCREYQRQIGSMLRAEGLTQGSVAERLRAFAADERFAIGDRDAVIAAMNAQLEKARSMLPRVIDATAAGGIQQLDPALSNHGTRGQRVGLNYLIDLQTTRPTWSLGSVVHHEHSPGHILQNQFNDGVPDLQQRYSSGYSEGWAIYAESLAASIGAFVNDPISLIGFLQWRMFRLARIVGDTGMHALRWSRERTIEQMYELQGESMSFVSIEDDVTRFAAQPGVAAVQGLAALHLMDLRARTEQSAGAQFSLIRFHNAALRSGPLSPPGLEQAMRAEFGL